MADWAPEHFVPVAGFLILALALLLFYFSAMRPRRGTTEWMGRIDRPRFTALRCGRLRALDAPWGVLAAVCGATVAVLAASAFAPQTADFLRLQMAFAAAEAAAAYLWLRLLCADALTAALSAALLALPAWTLTTLGRRWRGAEILCAVAMPLFYLMELWIP